jgi:hypothetical protein
LHSHSLVLFPTGLIEISVTDSIAFSDSVASLTSQATITDTITLTEAPSIDQTLQDSLTLTEADASVQAELYLADSMLLIDTAYRAQNETSIDDAALPHVQSISVQEPSVLQELPMMDGLPYRKQRGKEGRRITVTGWTDSLSTLETLRGYADGQTYLLTLPTGDSMIVHVTDVQTPEDVVNYDRYDYALTTVEVVD